MRKGKLQPKEADAVTETTPLGLEEQQEEQREGKGRLEEAREKRA